MQLELWTELVLKPSGHSHCKKQRSVYKTNMQCGPERLEGSQVTVVVTDTAAAKRGGCAPIPCPVLSAYCNEWMSLQQTPPKKNSVI